ncbi:MAG: ribosomal-processing cysteine protease Prp [Schwartzia sp.]|nr:ribosomal-processing cysteine protease Prp [Schwartzia sp. (in: firmicutes)]
MIRIKIIRSGNRIAAFRVNGHSGTAPRGEDIVCAGVSALAQTALLGLSEHLHRQISYDIQPGGDLRMTLRGEPDDLTEAILETMLLGMTEIQRQYPKAVQITES